MKDAGYIDLATYVDAVNTPLELKAGQIYTKIREPFFFTYVRELLIEKYGAATVRGGGLKVYTTINPRFQKLAVRAMREALGQPGDPASAIVSINPKNGAIRAMASAVPGRKIGEFNLPVQGKRQSGSSFKTFVLVEAVRQGINPFSTSYLSAPLHWQPDPNSEAWDVATYSHSYLGSVPISSATLSSDNTVYARLTLDVGPENVVKTARLMGIKTKLLAGRRPSGSARTPSPCSRWPRRTRPLPRAASSPSPWRSRRSCSRAARSTGTRAGASRSGGVS